MAATFASRARSFSGMVFEVFSFQNIRGLLIHLVGCILDFDPLFGLQMGGILLAREGPP